MSGINILAVLVAAAATVVVGMVWYLAFGSHLAGAGDAPERSPALTLPVEFARGLVLSSVVAFLQASGPATGLGIGGWAGAMVLGLALWLGFPATLFAGSVFHDGYPMKLAVIHAGDWLAKLLAATLILNLWP